MSSVSVLCHGSYGGTSFANVLSGSFRSIGRGFKGGRLVVFFWHVDVTRTNGVVTGDSIYTLAIYGAGGCFQRFTGVFGVVRVRPFSG